jgi:hypothetical protein
MADFSQIKNENSQMHMSFHEQLNQFGNGINNQDVLQQFSQLESANQAIYNQFIIQDKARYTPNILTNAAIIKNHFGHISEQVADLESKLANTLDSDLKSTVRDRLSLAFKDAFEDESIYLNTFFEGLDNHAHHNIQELIEQLPTLNLDDIKNSNLSEETYTQIKNAILVTNKYIEEEYKGYQHKTNTSNLLSTQIGKIKKSQYEDGLTMTDSVKIKGDMESTYIFTLDIPEHIVGNYQVSNLSVNGVNYTEAYRAGADIKLNDINIANPFNVTLTLKLTDQSSDIDVFQPFTWRWELYPERSENLSGMHSKQKPQIGLLANETINQNTEQEIEKENEIVDEPAVPEENVVKDKNQLNQVEENITPKAMQEEPEIKEIEITNNYIYHQVMSPKIEDTMQLLIDAASHTVSEYQKILALFEFYYGLNLEDSNLEKKLTEGTLTQLAKKEAKENKGNSLYNLYHETEIMDLLENFVVENIADKVTKQVREPIEKLSEQIDDHKQVVDQANQSAIQLSEEIISASEQAQNMNENLGEILVDLAAWREQSIGLINDQTEIVSNTNGELTAISTLGNDAQSLLMVSESLAEQARGNQNTAETVYETFDRIDHQATVIQESGSNLISEAEDLSISLTEKLLDNQDFSTNFSEVLDNSRIGDRQNEELYNFLSNPVQIKNNGTTVSGNTFTPYFLVLICFIVSLFTAYALSISGQKRKETDLFATEQTLMGKNASVTIITASIGFVEGILIGILSGYILQLDIKKLIVWIGLITLVMLTMLLISSYLLRQLKMIGMFILLTIFSLYLFLTESVGLASGQVEGLRMYSPLQHIETLLTNIVQGLAVNPLTTFILVTLMLIGVIANLLVLNNSTPKEVMEDEGASEAN